jgi:hypothetical protein
MDSDAETMATFRIESELGRGHEYYLLMAPVTPRDFDWPTLSCEFQPQQIGSPPIAWSVNRPDARSGVWDVS